MTVKTVSTADYEGAFTIGEKIHRVFIHNDVIKLPNRPLETLDALYWDYNNHINLRNNEEYYNNKLHNEALDHLMPMPIEFIGTHYENGSIPYDVVEEKCKFNTFRNAVGSALRAKNNFPHKPAIDKYAAYLMLNSGINHSHTSGSQIKDNHK